MKKLLSTLACGTLLATTASADFAQVKVGAGAWMNRSSTKFTYAYNTSLASVDDGIYTSIKTANTDGYVWMLVKHSIPLMPNIRLEYITMKDQGKAKGKFKNFEVLDFANAEFTMTQYDLIPYYNILDNTNWIILDLGLDIKVQNIDYAVSATKTFSGHNDTKWSVIPLFYVRGRVQTPITNISIESDTKIMPQLGVDIRAKVDYTLDIISFIQPTIEVGYRIQAFNEINDSSKDKTTRSIYSSGAYAGLNLSF